MRPPQNAGESAAEQAPVVRHDEQASMRPPQNAGESRLDCRTVDAVHDASMRPPQNAGESAFLDVAMRDLTKGFNEAPAERGGK